MIATAVIRRMAILGIIALLPSPLQHAVAAPPMSLPATSRPATSRPASGQSVRIFSYRNAEKARRLARWECKPLVVHFVPDTKLGADQLNAFYAKDGGVPRTLLDKVVIVVVPTERFRGFARQLGITGDGGYRTISAYDLGALDNQSQPTCRSGFV